MGCNFGEEAYGKRRGAESEYVWYRCEERTRDDEWRYDVCVRACGHVKANKGRLEVACNMGNNTRMV